MANANVYVDIIVSYTCWLLFLAFNAMYCFIRGLFWRYNGLHAKIEKTREDANYSKCAQVLRIIYKYRLDFLHECAESDFVTVHETFQSPDYILRDDVTLYTITPKEAVFVQADANAAPAFYADFYIMGQFIPAIKIIKIPFVHFNRLADNMEMEDRKIIFIHNQARCGGTLLTAIAKESGACVTFNEPLCFRKIVNLLHFNREWTGAEAIHYLRNTTRMLCKPYRGLAEAPLAYVIKPIAFDIVSCDMIKEAMPRAIQIFLYREPTALAVSMRRIGQAIISLKLLFYIPKIRNSTSFLMDQVGCNSHFYKNWTPTGTMDLEFGLRLAYSTAFEYLRFNRRGVGIIGIRYRDLIKHKDATIRKFFQACQLPVELVDKAKHAMERDSQQNSPISRENLNRIMPIEMVPKITSEFLEISKAMAKEFGVPNHESYEEDDFRLPDTIDPRM